jgi:hypothetical protein
LSQRLADSLDARLEVGIPSGKSIHYRLWRRYENGIEASVVGDSRDRVLGYPGAAQDLGPGFTKIKDGIRLEVSEAELM